MALSACPREPPVLVHHWHCHRLRVTIHSNMSQYQLGFTSLNRVGFKDYKHFQLLITGLEDENNLHLLCNSVLSVFCGVLCGRSKRNLSHTRMAFLSLSCRLCLATERAQCSLTKISPRGLKSQIRISMEAQPIKPSHIKPSDKPSKKIAHKKVNGRKCHSKIEKDR